MTHSFSFGFGFGNDDIEENLDETVDATLSDGTQKDNPIAAIDPKLYSLQDLVRQIVPSDEVYIP